MTVPVAAGTLVVNMVLTVAALVVGVLALGVSGMVWSRQVAAAEREAERGVREWCKTNGYAVECSHYIHGGADVTITLVTKELVRLAGALPKYEWRKAVELRFRSWSEAWRHLR